MSLARALLIAALVPLCAGAKCASTPVHGVSTPVTVTETRIVFVPIESALTQRVPIEPSGKPSECPGIARKRLAALETCNTQLSEIDRVQGTEKEPTK